MHKDSPFMRAIGVFNAQVTTQRFHDDSFLFPNPYVIPVCIDFLRLPVLFLTNLGTFCLVNSESCLKNPLTIEVGLLVIVFWVVFL